MTSNLLFQLPLFLSAVFLIFYLPGTLIHRISGFTLKSRLGLLSFRLTSGLLVIATVYHAASKLGQSTAFLYTIAFIGLASLVWLQFSRETYSKWDQADIVGLVVSIGFTGTLLFFSHFADFQVAEVQENYRDTLLSESVFHEGLINAIRFQFPPPAIYAAGSVDFSFYHLSMHLQIEAVTRLTGIPVNRLVYWYFPAIYFFLLFSLPFAFARQFNGSLPVALTSGALVFLGGLSWVPGIMQLKGADFAWLQYFHAAPFSLYTLNSLIPALAGLFAILLALTRLPQQLNVRYLVLLFLLVFGCFGLKSSMGLQIAAVLVFVAIALRNGGLAVIGLLALGLMFVDQFLVRSGSGDMVVSIQPGLWLNARLSLIGIQDHQLAMQVLFFMIALVLELGVRLLGLAHTKALWHNFCESRVLILFIVVFFISGFLISNLVFLGDSTRQFNHAEWFAIQSLYASWFLLFLVFAGWKVMSPSRVLVLVLSIVVSIPSILQLLWLKTNSSISVIGPAEKEVVDYLETTPVNSIVMHPLNLHSPSLASNLAGRMTVLNVYRSFVNESQGLEQRANAVQLFFSPDTDADLRQSIFNFYGVTHIYGPPELDTTLRSSLPVGLVMKNEKYAVWQYDTNAVRSN